VTLRAICVISPDWPVRLEFECTPKRDYQVPCEE
jgi:hypothetical protein